MANRVNFGKLTDIIDPPDLIEIQANSYKDFLQLDTSPNKRKRVGLQAVFKEVFPIESYDGKVVLDFVKFEVADNKTTPIECLKEGTSWAAPLYVTFRLKDGDEVREEDVYMGEVPLMTEQGSFIINGAERVVVSQLHRSPGICFEQNIHPNGTVLFSFRIIPDRGSWVEVQFDTSDYLHIYLDRTRRRRKFLASTFLRALGLGHRRRHSQPVLHAGESQPEGQPDRCRHRAPRAAHRRDRSDQQSVIGRKYEPLTKDLVKQIKAAGVDTVKVAHVAWDEGLLLKTVQKDPTKTTEEALKDIYTKLRPGDPPTTSNAKQLLKRVFFDPRRYDLSRVGRYKIEQKLGKTLAEVRQQLAKREITSDPESRVLEMADLLAAIRYLVSLRKGEGMVDDIDHLGSRRVRTVGELLENQCRVGLARTERLVKERMTIFDTNSVEKLTPAEAGQPEGAVRRHPRLLRPQPAQPVHGPDQSAGRTDPQAPSQRPRTGRSEPRARRFRSARRALRPTTAASARSRPRKVRTSV
jgi:DNA-directed RNA polymerase subunit beta